MARRLLPFAAAALIVLLPARAVRATVLIPADLSELSRDASAIVRGTVSAVRTEWAEGRRRVETLVTLDVAQVLKGDPGRTLVFKVPGGVMGRYRSVMIGAPSFREGEEVILFLGAQPPALPYLLGLGQGVYRIVRSGGAAHVVSPALQAAAAGTVTVRRGDPSRRSLTVEEFSARVRDALGSGSGRSGEPAGRVRRGGGGGR